MDFSDDGFGLTNPVGCTISSNLSRIALVVR